MDGPIGKATEFMLRDLDWLWPSGPRSAAALARALKAAIYKKASWVVWTALSCVFPQLSTESFTALSSALSKSKYAIVIYNNPYDKILLACAKSQITIP